MTKRTKKNSGFTLIELMIVFVIIIVLAGMVLRLMGLAGSKNAEAVTREKLERVAQALEEFRAIYGRYPPVDYYPGGSQPTEFEFPVEGPHSMPPNVASVIVQRSKTDNMWKSGGEGRVFTFGLLSYFFPRYKGHAEHAPDNLIGRSNEKYEKSLAINQWKNYNEYSSTEEMADLVQNMESARRILPYLGVSLTADGRVAKDDYGIVETRSISRNLDDKGSDSGGYVNRQLIIRDGWLRLINYRSRPPYDTYKLWSNGPDGEPDTDDDIVVGQG